MMMVSIKKPTKIPLKKTKFSGLFLRIFTASGISLFLFLLGLLGYFQYTEAVLYCFLLLWAIAMFEWTTLCGFSPFRFFSSISLLFCIFFLHFFIAHTPVFSISSGTLLFWGLFLFSCFILSWWIRKNSKKSFLFFFCFFLTGTLLISLGLVSLFVIFSFLGIKPFFFLLSIPVLTDIFAYFIGTTLGGPKLWPKISPKKTWSGFLGALCIVPLIGWAVAFWLFPIYFEAFSWKLALSNLTALCLISQGGDLLESAAKRYLNVKDSGTWLPGHGGLLDRIDSWLSVGLLSLILLLLFLFKP